MGMTVPIYVYMNDKQVAFFCTDRDRKERIKIEMRVECIKILDVNMKKENK